MLRPARAHSRAISVRDAGQHFAKLGVARCQPEGDREEHLRVSTDLTWDSVPPVIARSRAEALGGMVGPHTGEFTEVGLRLDLPLSCPH